MVSYHWLCFDLLQAKGRGRAEDSSYTVVEVKNTGVAEKEFVNEYRQSMMDKAIDKIRALNQEEYDRRVCSLKARRLNYIAVASLLVMFFFPFIRSQSFSFRLLWKRR